MLGAAKLRDLWSEVDDFAMGFGRLGLVRPGGELLPPHDAFMAGAGGKRRSSSGFGEKLVAEAESSCEFPITTVARWFRAGRLPARSVRTWARPAEGVIAERTRLVGIVEATYRAAAQSHGN
jgi:hypothetical protein